MPHHVLCDDPGVVCFVFGSLFKSSPVKHSYLSSCLDATSRVCVMIRELCDDPGVLNQQLMQHLELICISLPTESL